MVAAMFRFGFSRNSVAGRFHEGGGGLCTVLSLDFYVRDGFITKMFLAAANSFIRWDSIC